MSGIDKKVEELLQRMERMENELETKNVEVENLETKLKMECKAEVRKEVDKVLPTAVEQGLRDLPFEMVCAFKDHWYEANSVVSYNRTTAEFNNSDRPGGADGTMNIETGVFTAVTSGYYIITFSGSVEVHPGEYTTMWLHYNGVRVEESTFETYPQMGGSGDYIIVQGSRTVVSTLIVFNC